MKKTTILSVFAAAMLFFCGLDVSAQYVTVGNGTSPGVVPIHSLYKHGISQQIYTKAELGAQAMNIQAIAFHQRSNTNNPKLHHIKVYLTNTNKANFEDVDGWDWDQTVTEDDLYYDGNFWLSNEINQWTSIDLNRMFRYDGASNLLVTIINDADEWYSGYRFSCEEVVNDNYKAVYYAQDDAPYTISDINNPELSFDTRSRTERANIRLFTTTSQNQQYIQVGDLRVLDENDDNYYNYTDAEFPLEAFYNNSCSEQIFTTAELGGEGTVIYGVQFYQIPTNDGLSNKFRHIKLYFSTTSRDEFSNNTDWGNVVGSELVYEGGYALGTTEGWTTIWFDVPVTISSYNYILAMSATDEDYESGHGFATHPTDTYMNIIAYRDNVGENDCSFDLTTINSLNYSGDLFNERNTVRFLLASPQPGVAINEAEEEAQVAIYPNPTSGLLKVKADGLQRVELMDVTGKTIATTTSSTVDLTPMAAGVYMLRVVTDKGATVQKVVRK